MLPTAFAWFANLLGITYTIVTTVLFIFPPDLPVTGSNMNYCIVAFAIVVIISVFQCVIDGRRNYTGPRVDIDENVLVAPETRDADVLDGRGMDGKDMSDEQKEMMQKGL